MIVLTDDLLIGMCERHQVELQRPPLIVTLVWLVPLALLLDYGLWRAGVWMYRLAFP